MFLEIDKKKENYIAAVDDSGEKISYGMLAEFANDYQNFIPERSLVFVLSENSIGALAHYVACVQSRAVPLLIGAETETNQIAKLTQVYKPAYIIAPERLVNTVVEILGKEPTLVFSGFGFCLLSTGMESPLLNDELSLLLSTSGSTGSPKLVRHKYGNLESAAENVATVFGWTEDERAVCHLPLHYSMGLNVVNSHLYTGATVCLTKHNLMEDKFWEYVKTNQCTNFTGVPFNYKVMSRLHVDTMDLPCLQTLAQGGGRMPEAEFEKWASYAEASGRRFFATYGTTETSARVSYLPPQLATTKTCSIGGAIPGSTIFIEDDELVVRGPGVTMGYAQCAEDLSRSDDFLGEYHTGDLVRQDTDGCFYIEGRRARFLKLQSVRVDLDDVERLVFEEFGVECVCVGSDEKMIVYIVSDGMEKEVQSFLLQKTEIYRGLFVVRSIDVIPRGETGKILYGELACH
jgi:acyl-coenzyme A synthetase/AMP-(fatty) acid ligase